MQITKKDKTLTFSEYIEDFWDYVCVQLDILEDKEKQDMLRELVRRVKKYYKK